MANNIPHVPTYEEAMRIKPGAGQPTHPEQKSSFNLTYEHLVGKDIGISKIYASTQMLQTRISKELSNMATPQIQASLNARKVYDSGKEKVFSEMDSLEDKMAKEILDIKEAYIGSPATADSHSLTDIISISEQVGKAGNETAVYNALHGAPELRRYIAQYLKVFGTETETRQMLQSGLDSLVDDFAKSNTDIQHKTEVQNSISDLKMSFQEVLEDQVGSGALSFFKTGQILQEERDFDQRLKDQQTELDKQQEELEARLKAIEDKKKELEGKDD